MRIEVEKCLLQPVLDRVASVAAGGRQNLPILNNVLLTADGEELSIRATDLEVDIEARCACYVPEAGAITLPAKKLREIVRALPNMVDLKCELKDERMQIKSGRSRFTLTTLPAIEYPSLQFSDEGMVEMIADSSQLVKAINRVKACMAKDDVRYYLNGILFHLTSENQLKLVATDGHRMGFFQNLPIELNTEFSERQFIMPFQSLL